MVGVLRVAEGCCIQRKALLSAQQTRRRQETGAKRSRMRTTAPLRYNGRSRTDARAEKEGQTTRPK
ncbi:hypothetical protein TPADAL_0783b [Treponema pallidum subsp. pallidum DAL-1]|uniref:Uncharacterized protein n=1 Tax=Treponema pallidum subsp. endemicum str. Bosnia A TaxID=1155776 RepID=A0AAU8RXD7_TREPL|nr:hypothetical protein TPADAL_0783b [Treponema pallidum subsp. pallidum DAL-1]AJB40810.1 hypothetical protein TENDBA_0783b [Treponema pallidum subsp. endemicum str. Bosnia A]QBC41828.1 hypothetical protein TENDIB_0783b [Treponema pallidum subsp. endemicum]UPN52891.1 hypothetical protein TENDC279_0783b [Treponema pallidum subsp. endemicum]